MPGIRSAEKPNLLSAALTPSHEKENPKTTRAFPGKKHPGENGVFVSRASAPEAPAHVPARGLLPPCLGLAWALPGALPGLSRALLGACLGLPGLPGFAWVPWVPGKKGKLQVHMHMHHFHKKIEVFL